MAFIFNRIEDTPITCAASVDINHVAYRYRKGDFRPEWWRELALYCVKKCHQCVIAMLFIIEHESKLSCYTLQTTINYSNTDHKIL